MGNDAFASLISRPKRIEVVRLAYDPADADTLAEARKRLHRAQVRADRATATDDDHAELAEAEEHVDDLMEATDLIVFRFESIGPEKVEELMDANQPSRDDISKYRAAGGTGPLRYDPDEFPPQLVAATCIKVELPDGDTMDGLTVEQAKTIWATPGYTTTDLQLLFNAAQMVDLAASLVEDVEKG